MDIDGSTLIGPQAMTDIVILVAGAMQALLQEDLDNPKERIKVEEFTGY